MSLLPLTIDIQVLSKQATNITRFVCKLPETFYTYAIITMYQIISFYTKCSSIYTIFCILLFFHLTKYLEDCFLTQYREPTPQLFFKLKAAWSSIIWLYPNLFKQSTINRHLGYFSFFATTMKLNQVISYVFESTYR